MNVNPDFGIGAHGKAAAKLTPDRYVAGQFAEPRFCDCCDEEQNVVAECDPAQPRAFPGQCERDERQGDENVEKFSKYETTDFYGRIRI